jgi:hypothetical protein
MPRPSTIAALLALPLVAAACGGGSSSSSPPLTVSNLTPIAYVKGAAVKTANATSEHMVMKGLAEASGQQVTIDGDGDFDQRSHVGSMHVEFNAAGMSGSIDEVIAGAAIYMKSPLFAAAIPQGKTWLKLDLRKVAKAKGINFSALLSQNPSRTLAQLKALVRVTKIGSEHVDGTSTTHYRGHIDISKVPRGAKLEALTHATYTPFDIWVGNDDGYIRRYKFAVAAIQADGGEGTFSLTMDFSDFGKSVDVSEPAAPDVFDATNLAIPGLGG